MQYTFAAHSWETRGCSAQNALIARRERERFARTGEGFHGKRFQDVATLEPRLCGNLLASSTRTCACLRTVLNIDAVVSMGMYIGLVRVGAAL